MKHARSYILDDDSLAAQRLRMLDSTHGVKNKKAFEVDVAGVNDHPHSGWLGFPAIGRENKNTSVFQSLRL